MALESTQPLTEMSTRNIPGGKGRPTRKFENLTAICEPIAKKMWEPQRLTTCGPPRPVTGTALTLPFIYSFPYLSYNVCRYKREMYVLW
jgi:hypothetical protein